MGEDPRPPGDGGHGDADEREGRRSDGKAAAGGQRRHRVEFVLRPGRRGLARGLDEEGVHRNVDRDRLWGRRGVELVIVIAIDVAVALDEGALPT